MTWPPLRLAPFAWRARRVTVVRGVVRRGRALTEGLGEPARIVELGPELTITDDGAFWSPFAPTVVGGRLDTDLLVTRAIRAALASGRSPRRARNRIGLLRPNRRPIHLSLTAGAPCGRHTARFAGS